jgi:hypothetical protein
MVQGNKVDPERQRDALLVMAYAIKNWLFALWCG